MKANTTKIETSLENRKTLKSLFKQLTERTDNDEQTCFEQACLVFEVNLEEVDATDNTYKAWLIDALPLDIKVDYLYGLRPFKKVKVECVMACKDCEYNITRRLPCYAENPKTGVKIATKKPCKECKASSREKFFKGCFGDMSAIFGYPEPRITKTVITRAEQISYKFEISRRDGIRLEKAFMELELSYTTQEAMRKEYKGRVKDLFHILKSLKKEMEIVEQINDEDAMNFISSSLQDEERDLSDTECWIEEELERREEIGFKPASYDIPSENGYTYNKFDHASLLHHADICRYQGKIKQEIKKAKNQKRLKEILNQTAPLMRDAWIDYHEQSFSILCNRFSEDLVQAIREIRHNPKKRQAWKQRLSKIAYGKSFSIGESYPMWLNQQAQNTLWKQLSEPLIEIETI